jgi:hypothetical protein
MAFLKSIPYSVAENLSELSTHNGSKSKLVLPDGSTVVVKRR